MPAGPPRRNPRKIQTINNKVNNRGANDTTPSKNVLDVSIVIAVPDSANLANISGSYVIVAVYFVPSDSVPAALLPLIVIVLISEPRFKISEKDVSYAFTENGKPYVSSHPEINFSLSHTKNFAIAAFSEHEVGIDCESSGREIPARVLSKLFTKKETLSFDSEPILLWTAKDSVSKLTGYGVGGFNAIPELEYFSEKTEINGIFLRKLNVGEFTVVISSFTDDDISLTELK